MISPFSNPFLVHVARYTRELYYPFGALLAELEKYLVLAHESRDGRWQVTVPACHRRAFVVACVTYVVTRLEAPSCHVHTPRIESISLISAVEVAVGQM